MSAAEVLARHQWGTGACICGRMMCSHDDLAAHQLDALKAAGYAVVELPKPVVRVASTLLARKVYWPVSLDGEREAVSVSDSGEEVSVSGVGGFTPSDTRALAAALLAAANAAEADRC